MEEEKIDIKILYMDSDIPSIYFPAGLPKDGGSCAFATNKCMENCPSGMVVNEHEIYTLNYFLNNSAETITNKILEDFNVLTHKSYHAKIIQWHTWGDCLPELVEKELFIMKELNKMCIPQYGFTRNQILWNKIPENTMMRIGFTVDNHDSAAYLSRQSKDKMVCVPNTNTGYTEIYFGGSKIGSCSGWWFATDKETRECDCRKCLMEGEGCFYNKSFSIKINCGKRAVLLNGINLKE